MKLNDVIKRAPIWYKSGKSIYLKSPPGRGKTTTLEASSGNLSKQLNKNLGHVVINGPLLTPSDAIGYLIPKHMDDGRAESLYTDPFWFRTKDGRRLSEFDGGFVIVDEADKMDTDVKKVIGECALSKRLGPHTLSDGWVVWMAGNRSQDRSGSTKELDHLINRRVEIDVTDDLPSLLDWATANGVTLLTRAFMEQYAHIVLSDKVPEKQGPFCTPRSMVAADEFIRVAVGDGEVPQDPLLKEEVAGMIGEGPMQQYFNFVKLELTLPKFETIIKDPENAKIPQAPDAQMLGVYNLAERTDEDTLPKVIKYVQRFPQEFALTFAKSLTRRLPDLVVHPAMRAWCLQNASLMAALQ